MSSQNFIKFMTTPVLRIVTVILFLRDTTGYISATTKAPGFYSIAYVTAPSPAVARNISIGVVTRRIAACVNVIPEIKSVFEWEDRVHEDVEVMMMIKTRTSRIPDLIDFIKKVHPFDVCEVITVPITNGNSDYLNWISDQVPKKVI